MTPLLSVDALSKTFRMHHLGQALPAFERLSFTLSRGEFLLLSGPNGAGKSTLLRTVYRSYLPTGGRLIYDSEQGPIDLATAADVDIAHLRRAEIGFVTQFLTARPRVAAEEIVAEPLRRVVAPPPPESGAAQLLAGRKRGEADRSWLCFQVATRRVELRRREGA